MYIRVRFYTAIYKLDAKTNHHHLCRDKVIHAILAPFFPEAAFLHTTKRSSGVTNGPWENVNRLQ